MNDAGFLEAIRRAPDDPAPRLIYADWLDEAGDPRAGLIRAEERMRELAPFADEYWRLKPRRDRLKADAPPEWLHALGYDLPWPVFSHGWPDDWKGRWRVLRAFASNWFRVPITDTGGSRWAFRQVEQQLGRDLPPSLREFLAFDYELDANGHGQGGWSVEKAATRHGQAVAIRSRYQLSLIIALDDFARDDPPATTDWNMYPMPEEARRDTPCTLTEYGARQLVTAWTLQPDQVAQNRPTWQLVQAASEAFGRLAAAGALAIGERPGLVVGFRFDAQGVPWTSKVTSSGLSRRDIPRFVWDMCLGARNAAGIFDPSLGRCDEAGPNDVPA